MTFLRWRMKNLAVHGDKLLVTSNDSRIRMYDLRDMNLTCKFKGCLLENSHIRASFSPDGKHIISGMVEPFLGPPTGISEGPTLSKTSWVQYCGKRCRKVMTKLWKSYWKRSVRAFDFPHNFSASFVHLFPQARAQPNNFPSILQFELSNCGLTWSFWSHKYDHAEMHRLVIFSAIFSTHITHIFRLRRQLCVYLENRRHAPVAIRAKRPE